MSLTLATSTYDIQIEFMFKIYITCLPGDERWQDQLKHAYRNDLSLDHWKTIKSSDPGLNKANRKCGAAYSRC